MHGEFDTLMEVEGPELEVCGPIKWNGDAAYDLPAVEIDIEGVFVIQPTAGVVGYWMPGMTTATGKFVSPAVEWELKFHSVGDVNWVPGPALAFAGVRIITEGRDSRWNFELWNGVISLTTAL